MNKSPEKIVIAIAACAMNAAPHEALADDGGDSAIVVSARIDDPAHDATGGVRTLNRADLGAQASVSLLDNLGLLPGIDAFEKGGLGGGSYLSLRGGEPNFTLVTINGARVNDPMLSSGGGFDFSLLAPGDIDRIDVLSGPSSTAYGADALAGVVSLRTDAAKASGASARIGYGTGGRFEAGARAALTGRPGSLTFAASARDTEDLLSGASSHGQSAMISASPVLDGSIMLDVFGLYSRSAGRGFPEDSGGPDLAVIREHEQRERRQVALGATARAEISPDLAGQIRAGWSRSKFESESPGIAPGELDGVPPIASDSRFDRLEAVAGLDWKASDALALGLGASLVHESGRSDGIVDFGFPIPTAYSLSRSLPGLFATAALALPGKIELRAGLRADFPDSGKTRWTPRLGADVPIGDSGLRVAANYAQGFKQPSMFALGFPLTANPALLPERSRTIDAGLHWSSADKAWTASATVYRSVYRDLIDFDPELFINVNRSRVTARGIELAASGRSGPVRMIASLTYLDAGSADGATLRFRPEWKGAAALEWQVADRLSLRFDGRFTSAFNDSSIPTGAVRLRGFATFDAQAAFSLSRHLELRASLRNLADRHYYRTAGTPEPGRTVFVSLHGTL